MVFLTSSVSFRSISCRYLSKWRLEIFSDGNHPPPTIGLWQLTLPPCKGAKYSIFCFHYFSKYMEAFDFAGRTNFLRGPQVGKPWFKPYGSHLNLLEAIFNFHWFVSYCYFNNSLKFEFRSVYRWILSNFKLSGSQFECCFAAFFCVIISNLNIHDYKHVQIKQPVKITTLNSNFSVL